MTTKYLSFNTVAALNEAHGGPGAGVIDRVGIETQLARPATVSYGMEQFDTVWLKAAVLLHGISSTQYFSDGNKRTAWVAAILFLELNGAPIKDTPVIEAEAFALGVATQLLSIEKAAEWFEGRRITAADRKDFAFLASAARLEDSGASFSAEMVPIAGVGTSQLPLALTIAFVARFRWFDHDVGETRVFRLRFEGDDSSVAIMEPTADWSRRDAESGEIPISDEFVSTELEFMIQPTRQTRSDEEDMLAPTLFVRQFTIGVFRPGMSWLVADLDGEVFARLQFDAQAKTLEDVAAAKAGA